MSIRPLNPALAEKARTELNEDPNRIQEDLQHIKDWLAKQKHLRARTDDQWLLNFLRGCKFSLERTKEKLDLYYTTRTIAPEFYAMAYNSSKFEEILSLGSFLILPKLMKPDDPVTVMIRPGSYDPDKYNVLDVMSANSILNRIMIADNDNSVVAGVRTIMDLDGITMSHVLHMNPAYMKKLMVIGQDAAPTRMKGSHVINMPTAVESVFNMMKSFLNEKNKSRLYVHNRDLDSLYKHIPKDILPAEYGGNGGTIQEIIEYWRQKVKQYASWLEEDQHFGSDESKRPGKPKTAETMFGLDGSFRQLEFD